MAEWSRAGHWRDYGIWFDPDVAVIRGLPPGIRDNRGRIEKRPQLHLKQGAYALVSEHGIGVLKRGHELHGILAPLERRLMRLVPD
jgi:hypothetical protein